MMRLSLPFSLAVPATGPLPVKQRALQSDCEVLHTVALPWTARRGTD